VLHLAMVDHINWISKCGIESVALNTFINAQIETKKLRFHVPDENGKSKCHKLHIGAKVQNTIMEDVSEDTYLKDILSSDGRNTKNIAISKGIIGLITQIMNML
jgi:hypothetical protein